MTYRSYIVLLFVCYLILHVICGRLAETQDEEVRVFIAEGFYRVSISQVKRACALEWI